MNLIDALKAESAKALTENGHIAYNSTGTALIDLFGQIGSMRDREESEIISKFKQAYAENEMLAIQMIFYAGDIRHGGLGERRTFRILLKYLANNYPEIVRKNIDLIPYYNRYDSLFELVDTPVEKDMWIYISYTLTNDLRAMQKNESCSLLAKWMPSLTAHSEEKKALAKKACKVLALKQKDYRKMLSSLRNYLKVTERLMSDGKWDNIVYEMVPSYAMKNYRKAFDRHDNERFSQYKDSLVKGETKINSSVLYPYDIIKEYYNGWIVKNYDTILEEQWKALPSYVEDADVLVMADVSGSMEGRPMDTSIGLSILFSERNKGRFKDCFMTYSKKPTIVNLSGASTLRDKIEKVVADENVGYNTDLNKAFELLLDISIENKIPQNEMPKAICVISDMQIDSDSSGSRLDFVDKMRRKYAENGYEMPKLIMWNVESRRDTFLSRDKDIFYVSGQSQSMFKSFCACINGYSPYQFMVETLSKYKIK